jgi:hypothetical protein
MLYPTELRDHMPENWFFFTGAALEDQGGTVPYASEFIE